MKRKNKEAVLLAYLGGNSQPLKRIAKLVGSDKPSLIIIADRHPELGFTNLNVHQGDQILESHQSLSQVKFDELIKRLGKHHHLFIIY